MSKLPYRVDRHVMYIRRKDRSGKAEILPIIIGKQSRKRILTAFSVTVIIASAFVILGAETNQQETISDDIGIGVPRTTYYNERDQISFDSETTIGGSVGDLNSIATGDFDNDGDLEIVTVSRDDITIWRSTADPWQLWDAFNIGGFSGETGTAVAVGDLDNDGWLDLVAGDNKSKVWCWQNDGTPFDGWLGPTRITTTSTLPNIGITDLVIADINLDGWLDVIATDNSADGINLYMCKNDHTPFNWLWPGLADGSSIGSAATSLGIADIDLDGWPDIVVGHESGQVIAWQNNHDPFNSTVSMTEHQLCDLRGRGASVTDLALGDIDNDYDIDVVTSDDKNEIYVWKNLGGLNSWDPMPNISAVGVLPFNATALTLSDLDNDGWLDIFAGTDNEGRTLTIENDHSWNETKDMTLMGYGGEGMVLSVAIGDIDGDGDFDLLSGHYDYSGGGGTALSWKNILMHRNMIFFNSESFYYGTVANDGVPCDLDRDGDIDGAIARNIHPTEGELLLVKNTDSGAHLYSIEVGASLFSVDVADFDNDGRLELVGGNSGNLYIWYSLGDPWDDGWSQITVESDSNFTYQEIGTADLDFDGWVDIVVGGAGSMANKLRAYKNDGSPFDGGWVMNVVAQTFPGSVISLDLADFDNNGSLDIVAGGNVDLFNKIVVYENDKTPFTGYWPMHDIGTIGSGAIPGAMVTADFDNDGDEDLAVGEENGLNRIYLFENDGTPFDALWSSVIANVMLDDLFSMDEADFDLDGDTDLAIGCGSNEALEVRVLINGGNPFGLTWDIQDVGAPNSDVLLILSGDLERDGDPDLVALCSNSQFYTYLNIGAQVTEEAIDVSPDSISADTSAAVFRIMVRPNGIILDEPALLKKWCFKVYAPDGITPLTPAEMNETFSSFSLYLDDGDLAWSNVSDSLVHSNIILKENVVIMNISSTDPDAVVAQLSDAYFFFVVELQWGANIPGMRIFFDPMEWNNSWECNLLENGRANKCLSIVLTSSVMTKSITVMVIPEFASLLVPIFGMTAAFLVIYRLKGSKQTR